MFFTAVSRDPFFPPIVRVSGSVLVPVPASELRVGGREYTQNASGPNVGEGEPSTVHELRDRGNLNAQETKLKERDVLFKNRESLENKSKARTDNDLDSPLREVQEDPTDDGAQQDNSAVHL